MRYAIIGATVEQVKIAGGSDIKEARATGIIFANLTEAQAAQLRGAGCQVEPVKQVKTDVIPPVPVAALPKYSPEQMVWAIGIEELRGITTPPLYGEGLNLAIIDCGIRETHIKVNGRVVYSKNYTSIPMGDGFNHGTAVCSVALAMAPLCNILNLKVLGDDGTGSEEDVVMAIDDCITLNDERSPYAPQVINLSMGAEDDGNPYNPVRVACRAAIDRDIWVMAAAGNGGPAPGTIMSPACERYVFAAGSAKYEPFIVSDFSGRGPTKEGLTKPDGVMFGEDMAVASSESDTAAVAKSGTSFSTPFCSGMAILYHEGYVRKARTIQQLIGLPPSEIYYVSPKEVIDDYLPVISVKPEGEVTGKDQNYGYGLPYGPFVAQTLQAVPAAANIFSLLQPVLAIAMLGMVAATMSGVFKSGG